MIATVAVTTTTARADPLACCAALALWELGKGAPVVMQVGGSPPRPGLLASRAARDHEAALEGKLGEEIEARARGHICVVHCPPGIGTAHLGQIADHIGELGTPLVVSVSPDRLEEWRRRLTLIGAALPRDRELLVLLAASLASSAGLLRVDKRGPGRIGAYRALAGLPPGRAPQQRYRRLCRGL